MKNKAIFLDRDGTINVEKNYLYKVEDFELLPGVAEALLMLQKAGFKLIIITNQSGIARGYYTEKDLDILNHWMLDKLNEKGVHIDDIFYCPHLPNADVIQYRKKCNCRKPGIGLFEQAIKKYSIDLEESYSIGDKMRDCAISLQTKCKGFLIGRNEKESVILDVKNGKYENIKYCETLLDSAKEITSILASEK